MALFSSLSRVAPQPCVSRIVGAFWPGARPSAGKKLALIGVPSKDVTIASRADAAGAATSAAAATIACQE